MPHPSTPRRRPRPGTAPLAAALAALALAGCAVGPWTLATSPRPELPVLGEPPEDLPPGRPGQTGVPAGLGYSVPQVPRVGRGLVADREHAAHDAPATVPAAAPGVTPAVVPPPPPAPPAATPPPTARPPVATTAAGAAVEIRFAAGTATLPPRAAWRLISLVRRARAQGARLVVAGGGSRPGPLAAARARAVGRELVRLGAPARSLGLAPGGGEAVRVALAPAAAR